jgi:hypothetical protein
MGTAIEMWEAYKHGRIIVTICPMQHNWVAKFLSHLRYPDVETFEAELISGEFTRKINELVTV